jgi:undecaprenyl diphosphate synthase
MVPTADFHPSHGPIPFHVGIIPDGGRRWAVNNNCTLEDAYKQAISLLERFTGLFLGNGVQIISIYLNSIQNFRRKPNDLAINLKQIESALRNEIREIALQNGLRIVVAGNRDIIPASLLDTILTIERLTKDNCNKRINLLVAYDPLQEIIQACKASADPYAFFQYLWINTPVDLVIRSGNAPLLSNFLPLQSAYARLYFFEKLFNEITSEDITGVMDDFTKINRKFGE